MEDIKAVVKKLIAYIYFLINRIFPSKQEVTNASTKIIISRLNDAPAKILDLIANSYPEPFVVTKTLELYADKKTREQLTKYHEQIILKSNLWNKQLDLAKLSTDPIWYPILANFTYLPSSSNNLLISSKIHQCPRTEEFYRAELNLHQYKCFLKELCELNTTNEFVAFLRYWKWYKNIDFSEKEAIVHKAFFDKKENKGYVSHPWAKFNYVLEQLNDLPTLEKYLTCWYRDHESYKVERPTMQLVAYCEKSE